VRLCWRVSALLAEIFMTSVVGWRSLVSHGQRRSHAQLLKSVVSWFRYQKAIQSNIRHRRTTEVRRTLPEKRESGRYICTNSVSVMARKYVENALYIAIDNTHRVSTNNSAHLLLLNNLLFYSLYVDILHLSSSSPGLVCSWLLLPPLGAMRFVEFVGGCVHVFMFCGRISW